MTEDEALQADIDRIAKLRGRPAPKLRADTAENVARRMGQQRLRSLFVGAGVEPEVVRGETLIFDVLPLRSRAFIRDSPVFISPAKWADLLLEYSEDALLDLVSQCIAMRGQELVRRRYGPTHPQVEATDFTMKRSARNPKIQRDSDRVRIVARKTM
jgi:hypothetical protein